MTTITTTFRVLKENGSVRLSVGRLVLEHNTYYRVGLDDQGLDVYGCDEAWRKYAQKLAGELLVFLSDHTATWEQVVLWLAEHGVAQDSAPSTTTVGDGAPVDTTPVGNASVDDAPAPGASDRDT